MLVGPYLPVVGHNFAEILAVVPVLLRG